MSAARLRHICLRRVLPRAAAAAAPALPRRAFSSSPRILLAVSPTRYAAPPAPAAQPAALSEREYHDKANEYLDHVVSQYEDMQDRREDIDVEFSSGVLTVAFARQGTYVINKQPPNKQIWLSSPITGPRRFDYVAGAGAEPGKWISLRDGTSLGDILREETGVDI